MKPHQLTTTQLGELWEPYKRTVQPNTAIRIHRSLSWLKRAEACQNDDPDIALLCRWSAFNALYAQWNIDEGFTEPEKLSWQVFADRILNLDSEQYICFVIQRQDRRINEMFASKYLNRKSWSKYEIPNHKKRDHSVIDYQQWRQTKNWSRIFDGLLDRIYLIRCQMIHGGATYNSNKNRRSVSDCNIILHELINAVFLVLIDHGTQEDWGIMCYPPLD
ncbi:MAG: hypothetical protein CMJ76_16620 [Planctomycetaceae bacterium]|nr:hypothetical protein [Planctomycetaceae bacterium]|tara:strand:+ start:979 stop:1635 length:657 start_codon:yes stop_codon:yes gene_type:complete